MSNVAFKLAFAVMLACDFCALFWAYPLRRGFLPILLLNILTAGLVLAYQVPRILITLRTNDVPVMALILFELATLALAATALSGSRMLVVASLVSFGLNGLACAALTVFAFSFRMTRLF